MEIDLTGKSLLPGWVMLHEHMYSSAFSFNPTYLHVKQLPVTFPRMYLAAGATTIRTCGSIEPYSDLRIKKDIDCGLIPGPSMELRGLSLYFIVLCCTPCVTHDKGHQSRKC